MHGRVLATSLMPRPCRVPTPYRASVRTSCLRMLHPGTRDMRCGSVETVGSGDVRGTGAAPSGSPLGAKGELSCFALLFREAALLALGSGDPDLGIQESS